MSVRGEPIRVHTLIDSLSWGGAEMLLGDLAAGAPSAGIEMSVGYLLEADGSPAAARLRARGVEPAHVPVRRLLDAAGAMAVRRDLAQRRPDLVHTHLGLADMLGTVAARSLGVPSVSTIHLLASRPTGRPDAATRRGLARTRLAAELRRRVAARVIAVSDAAREAYLAAGYDVPGHVATVHNGIAAAPALADEGARVRAGLGLAPDALVAVTVTVLRPGKGHDLAIEAVARLRDRFPGLRLVILGDGPARAEIAALAAPLGDAVLMPGHRDDVGAVLAAADVLVHPTRVDAFPTALLEAAAAGVPAVATAVGGIPEIVGDGDTGLLLPAPPQAHDLAARLGELLADAQRRTRLGAHARQRFDARFSAERWAQRLRPVYDDVLAGRSGRRSDRRGSRPRHSS